MKISAITDRSTWQKFFNENGSPSFLESWEWGEFQKKQGYGILRLGLYQKNLLLATALVIKIRSRRGKFYFIPHGPLIKLNSRSSTVEILLHYLSNYLVIQAKKDGSSFIRFSPIMENTPENYRIFKKLGFVNAPIYMHAERVWALPLARTDEELLLAMRKTTRYSIRKAMRDGVLIEKRTDQEALGEFWKIYQKTAKREHFIPFSIDYISQEFEAFHKTGDALFLLGKSNNEYLAAALILFTKSSAFYHQGASVHTKIPATSLLQWEAILEAKKRGCAIYNFWGILQAGRSPKNWEGLTLFKTGFGGAKIDYLTTQDYIITYKYYLTFLYEKFLSWRRGV